MSGEPNLRPSQSAKVSDDDDVVVTRRRAMRMAAAAGAAAAVWASPRIEGFSVVPDFASAASCTSGSRNAPLSALSRSGNCCWACSAMYCWNNGAFIGCEAGCFSNTWGCASTPTSGSLNIAKNTGGNITLNYALRGGVDNNNRDNSSLNLSLSGMDTPFISCTVTVNGTCNSGGNFAGGFNSGTVTTNGAIAGTPLNPRCSGVDWCNTSAALTIALSCNCA